MPAPVVRTINVPNVGEIKASARPDPFDARDFVYRPRLNLLPAVVDQRTLNDRFILRQEGNSCTGHAMAAMINTALAAVPPVEASYVHVSPFMLYHFARRYDEFEGEEDAGSSLRGALKGWWRHGVGLDSDWPSLTAERDLHDAEFAKSCAQRPLGAFYRVDPERLDDMQSAITELHAIVASASVHDGWLSPQPEGENLVIRRGANSEPLGGHAFALVGYNEVGFLVQNSWGASWGKGGFATLPYEEWLDCAWDAWVARPGVPHTPLGAFVQRRVDEHGQIIVGKSLDMARLNKHVLNLGNDGLLSQNGIAISNAAQLHGIISAMRQRHAEWNSRHVVFYAHGGLNSESTGLETAQGQLQWWLDNHVFPVFFVWEAGAGEVIKDSLADLLKKRPAGGLLGKVADALDVGIEKTVRSTLFWAWDQMKQNGRGASKDIGAATPPDPDFANLAGASLFAHLLKTYVDDTGPINLHLLAHSAGAVVLGAMLDELRRRSLPVNNLIFMASAGNFDDFEQQVLPNLSPATRFTTFGLVDKKEQDDKVLSRLLYRKSLLYLVSRGFEHPKSSEQPLVGMARFAATKLPAANITLDDAVSAVGGERIWAPTSAAAAPNARSAAEHHTDFDADVATMTSVARRILGRDSVIEFELDRKLPAAGLAMGRRGVTPADSPIVQRGS